MNNFNKLILPWEPTEKDKKRHKKKNKKIKHAESKEKVKRKPISVLKQMKRAFFV